METYDNAITKEELFSILDYSKQIQKKVLYVFKSFHDICINNNIQFSLCEGSLLGCVRHNGFVPWDDDIDIYMTNLEFDKLTKTINESINIVKKSSNFYFFYLSNNKTKIDIFLHNFREGIYSNKKYVRNEFENFSVFIPKDSICILDSIYDNWQKCCCITNHKISMENFKSSCGYKSIFRDKYKKLSLDLANMWVHEYETKYENISNRI